MKIELITYGDDAVWKRKTVMRDGVQCGYVNDAPGAAVLMTVPADPETKDEIAAEVARIKGCDVGPVAAPVPLPADAFDEEEEDEYETE
jgi:hypothetical protein